MKANIERLRKVLDHIKAHPDTWDQKHWNCGACFCFAGHAIDKFGSELDLRYLLKYGTSGTTIVPEKACQLLGLVHDKGFPDMGHNLFLPVNKIEDLERMIDQIEKEQLVEEVIQSEQVKEPSHVRV